MSGKDDNPLGLTDSELTDVFSEISEDELEQILEETRPSIDGYASILSDIDDKAARTLRLNTVIFGFILTFASVVTGVAGDQFGNIEQFVNAAYFMGLLATGISATLALITYTQSQVRNGFSSEDVETYFRESINNGLITDQKVLLFNRVRSHVHWIQSNREMNRLDSNMLFASHIFLFISLGNYALAVIIGSLGGLYWIFLVLLSIFVSMLLTVVVTLPRNRLWPVVSTGWEFFEDNVLSRLRR